MSIFRRSILWIVPVVVIPLAALLIVQYRFLRALESKTVSAQQNWLRESAERVAEDIDHYYRTSASRVLTFDRDCLCRPDLLRAHFARTPIRGARTFFVARFDHGIHYSYFSPQGSPKLGVGENEEQAVRLATVTWHLAHEMNRPAPHPPLLVDEHDGENRIVMRPVVNDLDRVLGVAGIVFDERLTREAMMDLGNESLKAHYPSDAPVMRVRIYGRQLRDQPVHTQPLSFVFSDWRLGIQDLCSTPEELAALSFKNNMMLGGGVMIVLFGAIGLAVQAASRQMKLSQMKSDFVSNVSHELRTPLASIRVFGEYMRLGRVTSDEKVREYGEYIEAESRRLTQLINNILDFSKIESAQKKYKMAEADI